MDPSYFLLPAIELLTEYVPKEPEVEDILQDYVKLFVTEKRDNVEETKLIVNLSKTYPEGPVLKQLLKNSKALWRTSLWNSACMS